MFTRLNAYHIMWLFVFFDLPTNTQKERKAAANFRKNLLKDGFAMMQYSVYIRHCASDESANVHIKRIKSMLPPWGEVSILKITDKQFERMLNFYGRKPKEFEPAPSQLELF